MQMNNHRSGCFSSHAATAATFVNLWCHPHPRTNTTHVSYDLCFCGLQCMQPHLFNIFNLFLYVFLYKVVHVTPSYPMCNRCGRYTNEKCLFELIFHRFWFMFLYRGILFINLTKRRVATEFTLNCRGREGLHGLLFNHLISPPASVKVAADQSKHKARQLQTPQSLVRCRK